MDARKFQKLFDKTADNINSVVHGKDDVVRLALTAIMANGHVLFEDVPGVGKSVLARAISQTMHAHTARVQCTPDMLPGDITGSSVIDNAGGSMKFVFKEGPVFTNVLLVDEINRATPKTQSALLEAMAERNVSVDGVSRPLPKPFLVLATQNPVEQAGTFPLPEAQLDRFLFRLKMGYANADAERLIIRGNTKGLQVDDLEPVTTTEEILSMQSVAMDVELPESVEGYIIAIVAATRDEPALTLGASPRALISLAKAARVLAAADGRDQAYPEDVKVLLRPVLAHRLMLSPDATLRGETIDDVLDRIVNRVKAPLGVSSPAPGRRRSEPTVDVTGPGGAELVAAGAANGSAGESNGSTRRRRRTNP
jgi:MoxR-like ATPase